MKYSILLFFMTSWAFAGTVEWNSQKVTFIDADSLKSFSGKLLSANLDPGATIYALSFSSEEPDTKVFPDTMTGITFLECHLDNVIVPPGNLIVNFYTNSPIRYKFQNDLREWIIDDQDKPIKLMNESYWADLGYDIDPANIPATPYDSIDEISRDIPIDSQPPGGGGKPCGQ
jgi:hypothetical protein